MSHPIYFHAALIPHYRIKSSKRRSDLSYSKSLRAQPDSTFICAESPPRKSQAQLSSTLHLQSSSTLGTGIVSTNQARLEKQEDKEVRRALHGFSKGRKRRHTSGLAGYHSEDSESRDEADESDLNASMSADAEAPSVSTPATVVDMSSSYAKQPAHEYSTALGSALRRNEDGSIAQPRMLPKKDKNKRVTVYALVPLQLPDGIDLDHLTKVEAGPICEATWLRIRLGHVLRLLGLGLRFRQSFSYK